jgi:hypothetical protein
MSSKEKDNQEPIEWSALDMALVLELALHKEGDTNVNVITSIERLAAQRFREKDSTLPAGLQAIAAMADPVSVCRTVTSSFIAALNEQSGDFVEKKPRTRKAPPAE